MFSFQRCFYKSALFINTTKYPPEWKNASFLEEDILQEIFFHLINATKFSR